MVRDCWSMCASVKAWLWICAVVTLLLLYCGSSGCYIGPLYSWRDVRKSGMAVVIVYIGPANPICRSRFIYSSFLYIFFFCVSVLRISLVVLSFATFECWWCALSFRLDGTHTQTHEPLISSDGLQKLLAYRITVCIWI